MEKLYRMNRIYTNKLGKNMKIRSLNLPSNTSKHFTHLRSFRNKKYDITHIEYEHKDFSFSRMCVHTNTDVPDLILSFHNMPICGMMYIDKIPKFDLLITESLFIFPLYIYSRKIDKEVKGRGDLNSVTG